jgi:hypothetical protein
MEKIPTTDAKSVDPGPSTRDTTIPMNDQIDNCTKDPSTDANSVDPGPSTSNNTVSECGSPNPMITPIDNYTLKLVKDFFSGKADIKSKLIKRIELHFLQSEEHLSDPPSDESLYVPDEPVDEILQEEEPSEFHLLSNNEDNRPDVSICATDDDEVKYAFEIARIKACSVRRRDSKEDSMSDDIDWTPNCTHEPFPYPADLLAQTAKKPFKRRTDQPYLGESSIPKTNKSVVTKSPPLEKMERIIVKIPLNKLKRKSYLRNYHKKKKRDQE